jgi:indole-3-glycerol phosphate synthase
MLRKDFDVLALHRAYAEGGADAYSILTEEDYFDGSLDYIRTLRPVTDKPLLRKDFVLEDYQLYETRASGADAVLLIAALLEGSRLERLIDLASRLSLAALVEVHDEAELEKTLAAGARIVGINNRNLHTFEVDLAVTERLRRLIPDDRIVVAESGIGGPADVARLLRAGVSAFLIGEYLMRSENIPGTLTALKESL